MTRPLAGDVPNTRHRFEPSAPTVVTSIQRDRDKRAHQLTA
jgi:hypothetical protein